MNKTVSLLSSVITLTVSGVRSTQAQALLNFVPARTQPALKPTQQSESLQPGANPINSAAIAFQASPRRLGWTHPNRPMLLKLQVIDTAADDDRLVVVAPDELFEGGSDSLVAKAVGSAEGTRTPDGGKTWAYYGHSDPGNRRWNLGSFSYQHGANSPEKADRRQLNRLRRQFDVIQESALAAGLRLGLEEQLNGIDLANQAPLAALDRGGYVDRLRQAYGRGLRGAEAVLQARTYSYLNPLTNQWDAPGLGNTLEGISRDQARRQHAVAEAMNRHQQTSRFARSQ